MSGVRPEDGRSESGARVPPGRGAGENVRLSRLPAVAVAFVLAAILVAAPAWADGPGGPPSPTDAAGILGLAMQGARTIGYAGTETVVVRAAHGPVTSTLTVAHRATDDRTVIQPGAGTRPGAGAALLQVGSQRAAVGMPGGLASRGQAPPAEDPAPTASVQSILDKYAVGVTGPVQDLGRPAWLLAIQTRAGGQEVERWTVDAATGLVLARVTYAPDGSVERSAAFTEVRAPYTPSDAELAGPAATPAAPSGQQWFHARAAQGLAASLHLPAALPGGYQLRSGARFRVGSVPVVQLVYSDGLEEVSLFRQPGMLTRASVPADARTVKLGHGDGLTWDSFPRGAAWQGGGYAYSLVGGSPASELRRMADTLPQGPMRRSVGQRLRHLITWLHHLL